MQVKNYIHHFHYSYSGWREAPRDFTSFFAAFASGAKDLTQRRGLVEMSSAGRTATPATEDPRGTPETGSISTSTATCTLRTWHSLYQIIKLEKVMKKKFQFETAHKLS